MEGRYQIFVLYLRDHCDCAGVWQPSFKLFEVITGFRIDQKDFLEKVNIGRERIIPLKNGKWWISGFVEDQSQTNIINTSNNAHKGIKRSLDFNEAPYLSMGYKLGARDESENVVSPTRKGREGKGSIHDHEEDRCKEETINPVEPDHFFTFWHNYPKKVGKADAAKAWKKIPEPKTTLVKIINALEWQRKSDQWTKDHGQFIPNPSTYLNQGRWEDEPVLQETTESEFV